MARILVVEDDETIRDLVNRVLEAGGHEAEGASSAKAAIERLTEKHYDLVVLDVMLGPISGWDVLSEMSRKGLREGTRVLMLTALTSERDFLKGWRLGVDQYLTKPFHTETVRQAVDDVLQRTREELAERRKAEVEKAELLFRLESAFERRAPNA